MNTERDSRFELLRIIACVLIVFNHYASHGVLMINQSDEYMLWAQGAFFNRLFVMLLTPGGRVGVAVFFMLSGYYLINNNKKHNWTGIISHTYYYAIVCSIIAVICFFCGNPAGYTTYGICTSVLKYVCIPISSSGWWFVTVYILLLFGMPLINTYIDQIGKRRFIFILSYLWIFAYGLGGAFETPFNLLFRGCFFYLIGGFFRKYYAPKKEQFQLLRVGGFICSWISCSMISFFSASQIIELHADKTGQTVALSLVENLLFIPICAILLFSIAINTRINKNTIVNKLAGYSFGVYLFHDSDLTRNIVWTIARVQKQYQSESCAFMAVITCLGIIAIACLFEWIYKAFYARIKERIYRCNSIDAVTKADT